MNFFKVFIALIIAATIAVVLTKPDMHKPFRTESADFKLSVITENPPAPVQNTLKQQAETVKKYVSHVVLLGLAKDRFESELRKNGYDNIVMISGSFQDGVDKAFELPDEVILLSPACSSYDMFSGYEERGKVFKEYALSKK